MTAFDDMKTTVEAVKAGAFEYLVKPLDNLELDLTIDKALQMKRWKIRSVICWKKSRKNIK